jgi:hypothetical protein
MKYILYILILFNSTLVLGQGTELNGQFELDSLQNSENKWHFRLSMNNYAIDVWQDEAGQYFGAETIWVYEYIRYNDEEETNRIYFEKIEMDSTQVEKILSSIDSTQIKNIPDQNLIEGWVQAFDGTTFVIETLISHVYQYKTYWTPSAQDSLPEAIAVLLFVNRSLEIIEAHDNWIEFASRIPYECYSTSIGAVTSVSCNILTKKESRKFKKERKSYRQHQPDSLID